MTPKELWAAALKSGKYAQGQSYLRSQAEGEESRWCCLGVLCELYRQETGYGTWSSSPLSDNLVFDVNNARGESYPPLPVLLWAGTKGGEEDDFVSLNDVVKVGFDEIAEVVLGRPASDFWPVRTQDTINYPMDES